MKVLGKRSVASLLTLVIDLAWYAVAIGVVATVCLLMLSLFLDLSGGDGQLEIPASVSIDTTAVHIEAPSLGIEDAKLQKVTGQGVLRFHPPGRTYLAMTALVMAVSLAFVLWVLSQLRAVFRTLRAGTPFVPDNVARIRRIGYAVILGELARTVLVFVSNYHVLSHFFVSSFSAERVRFTAWPDLSIATIVHGAIIVVLAEVFKVGTRLDEEQSLTV
jgi:hypothetical protein